MVERAKLLGYHPSCVPRAFAPLRTLVNVARDPLEQEHHPLSHMRTCTQDAAHSQQSVETVMVTHRGRREADVECFFFSRSREATRSFMKSVFGPSKDVQRLSIHTGRRPQVGNCVGDVNNCWAREISCLCTGSWRCSLPSFCRRPYDCLFLCVSQMCTVFHLRQLPSP